MPRAKAGDPPRTMVQKILAGRVPPLPVDQVALVRAPHAALDAAIARGLKKAAVEAAVAYETACITTHAASDRNDARHALLSHGVAVARAGAGFASHVHLERFAGPSRSCLTDEPRLAALGGIGMLVTCVSPSELAAALCGDPVELPAPRSVHVQLSGKLRPFVTARDLAFELVRRGLHDVVERATWEHGAPVVIEVGGAGARLLSVPDRAVLAAIAPRVGAAAVLFPSDERTEVFLRDQRRSKAHRSLSADAGAPYDEVVQVDASGVDPLVLDDTGKVRPIREVQGKPVTQVVLGGDAGATLRDLLSAAALLKSKRVPSNVEVLLCPPTRQVLEVLAAEGALADLITTGARLIEPDARVVSGELYPPPGALSLHTSDVQGVAHAHCVSAETAAWAVATGTLGDPRGFKRPMRVSVPRSLPTEDVLIVRPGK